MAKEYDEKKERPENDENSELKKMGIRKDVELYNYVINSFNRSKKYLDELKVFETSERYSKIYEGGIWKVQDAPNRPDYLSQVNVALAFDVVETGLAIATARPPAPEVEPEITHEHPEYQQVIAAKKEAESTNDEQMLLLSEEMTREFKDKLSDYSKSIQRELVKIWKRTDMHEKNQMGFREMGKTGTSFLRSVYDPEKKKIINEICDITSIFPSPNVDTIEKHAELGEPFIYAFVLPVEKAKEVYGVEVLDEASIGDFDDLKIFKHRSNQGTAARVYAAVKSALETLAGRKKKDYCYVLECYMPDKVSMVDVEVDKYDEEGIKVTDDNGESQKENMTRPKFGSGFKVVTVIRGHKDWIVGEDENLYKDGRPPFFENRNYPVAGQFHGTSEVKHIEDLIMRLNVILSNTVDNIRHVGNPALVVTPGTKTYDGGPFTNRVGNIILSPQGKAGVGYLEPPNFGHDYKFLIDFFMRIIDRVSRLAEALRGGNEFAADSGRKIRELRQAASGLFQPKLDGQIKHIITIFSHWAHILQYLYDGILLQEIKDDDGDSNYEEFIPSEGRDISLHIDVSMDSILPRDQWAEWEEGLQLFQLGLIAPEHLIELAPTLEDKQRAITFSANQQKANNIVEQRNAAFERFVEVAAEITDIAEVTPNSGEEEGAFDSLIAILEQFPEFIKTPEFQALHDRIKITALAALADLNAAKQEQEILENVEVSQANQEAET